MAIPCQTNVYKIIQIHDHHFATHCALCPERKTVTNTCKGEGRDICRCPTHVIPNGEPIEPGVPKRDVCFRWVMASVYKKMILFQPAASNSIALPSSLDVVLNNCHVAALPPSPRRSLQNQKVHSGGKSTGTTECQLCHTVRSPFPIRYLHSCAERARVGLEGFVSSRPSPPPPRRTKVSFPCRSVGS